MGFIRPPRLVKARPRRLNTRRHASRWTPNGATIASLGGVTMTGAGALSVTIVGINILTVTMTGTGTLSVDNGQLNTTTITLVAPAINPGTVTLVRS